MTFTTAAAVVSYLLLVADFYFGRVKPQAGFDSSVERHVIFVLVLLLTGVAVRYQVGRARALSRFYASRRPHGFERSLGPRAIVAAASP